MSDAPERIWAFDYDLENHDGTSVNVLVWDQNRPWPFKAAEYIRADLSQAAVEALAKRLDMAATIANGALDCTNREPVLRAELVRIRDILRGRTYG